jgi:hypothetical protein
LVHLKNNQPHKAYDLPISRSIEVAQVTWVSSFDIFCSHQQESLEDIQTKTNANCDANKRENLISLFSLLVLLLHKCLTLQQKLKLLLRTWIHTTCPWKILLSMASASPYCALPHLHKGSSFQISQLPIYLGKLQSHQRVIKSRGLMTSSSTEHPNNKVKEDSKDPSRMEFDWKLTIYHLVQKHNVWYHEIPWHIF